MGSEQRAGQVVVGVSSSLAGLRALRDAVAEARRRGQALAVVRAYPAAKPNWADPGPDPAWLPGARPAWVWEAAERQARADAFRAFDEAMGGVPDDVQVQVTAAAGKPGQVLVVAAAHPDDLLVVGTPRRRGRAARGGTSGYCTERASCPVLVVPPPEGARGLDGGRLRRWRWRRRNLSRLPAELTSPVGPVRSP